MKTYYNHFHFSLQPERRIFREGGPSAEDFKRLNEDADRAFRELRNRTEKNRKENKGQKIIKEGNRSLNTLDVHRSNQPVQNRQDSEKEKTVKKIEMPKLPKDININEVIKKIPSKISAHSPFKDLGVQHEASALEVESKIMWEIVKALGLPTINCEYDSSRNYIPYIDISYDYSDKYKIKAYTVLSEDDKKRHVMSFIKNYRKQTEN